MKGYPKKRGVITLKQGSKSTIDKSEQLCLKSALAYVINQLGVDVAPNFCANCGEKVIPEQKFCPNCGVSVATASSNIVTDDSAQFSTALSSTAQPRAHSTAFKLGITGGVIGVIIGALFLAVILFVGIPEYNAGYYPELGPRVIGITLASFGLLAFSILGALGAAQKLDARPKVNAWALFLAGVVVLLCMVYLITPGAIPDISLALIFVFIGLVISVLFFLSGYLLLRKPILTPPTGMQ